VVKKGIRVFPSSTRIKRIKRNAIELGWGITKPIVLAAGMGWDLLEILG
jgi:hypothetical protein